MKLITKIKNLLKKKKTIEMKLVEKQTELKEKKREFRFFVDKFNTGKYNKDSLNTRILKLKDEIIDLNKQVDKIKQEVNLELVEKSNELNKDTLSIIKAML